jgi:hypothetical protein
LGLFPYQQIYELVEAGILPTYVVPGLDSTGNAIQFNPRIVTYVSHVNMIMGVIIFALVYHKMIRTLYINII